MKRRRFLSHLPAIAAIGGLPRIWHRAAEAAAPRPDEPIVVVVELTGGNDGLNTVIPYRDDAYHRARPTLRIAPGKVLRLDDALGLHPAMTDLHKCWENGTLRVVMNVGYPKPSRSHTRAMEIWQSAELTPLPTSGWVGRASDIGPARAPACFVGTGATPMAVRGRGAAPFVMAGVESLALRPDAQLPATFDGDPSEPAAQVARAMDAARVVSRKAAGIKPAGSPDGLEARLSTICGCIGAGLGSRIYYTALDGFDTHAGQQYAHADLLSRLSKALSKFQSALEAKKLDDRVLVLVFSEFGRRTAENGSKGTDHGAAAPVLLLGSPVAGGLLGGAPDLANLDEGDLRFTLDFRDLYAGILADWLRVDPFAVIGRRSDDRVKLLGRAPNS